MSQGYSGVTYLQLLLTVHWQVKYISVEREDDKNKFNKMIFAIRQSRSIPGYSTMLWEVPDRTFVSHSYYCLRILKSNSGSLKQAPNGF